VKKRAAQLCGLYFLWGAISGMRLGIQAFPEKALAFLLPAIDLKK
jgi:hypothetical protein